LTSAGEKKLSNSTLKREDMYEVDADEDAESLSKMEPPQFQSPTLSAMSPSMQMKDYNNDDDDKLPPLPPFM
jgi:hypothetical protein